MHHAATASGFAVLIGTALIAGCSVDVNDGSATQASEEALHQGSAIVDSLDESGVLRTFSTNGTIDRTGPFFQSLGTNGRRCSTCHISEAAWTITPAHVRDRFEDTDGLDPIFRTNDGSNARNVDVSTKQARRKAYSMLLSRAVIRVGIPVPLGAEFDLAGVDDPYRFASATELSLFRRPLPTTNLKFLSTVMWDGRETLPGQSIHFDLGDQANGATLGHAEGAQDLTDAQRSGIVAFEEGLFTAQIFDRAAGDLRKDGGRGGPENVAAQEFFLGINDPLGQNPTGKPFDPVVFTLYQAWSNLPEPNKGARHDSHRDCNHNADAIEDARESVARGEDLFNTLPIDIVGVKGLNDDLGAPVIPGHCTTCHDTPNSGNHSVKAPLDIGLTDASRRTPDMPLYTLRNKVTGEKVQTTDPGRALISGRWKDIGRFKGPILRGLAARAPYFHNGFADSLDAVVAFYETRFALHLTTQQKRDLVAFLRTL
jgi:cytochrome c peroxidase